MTRETFFDRPESFYFVPDAAEAADFCRTNWPEEAAHIIRIADEVCRNEFLFDLNWDMERTWEPVIFEGDIDWSVMPAGDPEFVWQFNRHRFFICLGQAWQLTGDEKYVRGFLRLINDWMDRVPLSEETKNGPWRMLEVGLRGETWTKAVRYFKDSPLLTDEFWDRFHACLCAHADRLVEQGGDARLQSNWCVLENSGLLEIALGLPAGEKTEEWIGIALERLDRASRVQVYEDGSQWEQSPMYHNEVYHCLCCCVWLARINGIELPQGMEERVHKMALANLIWRKPDGHQFAQGDSDDTDLRDVLTMGAFLFEDPVLKYAGFSRMDYEGAWDFGRAAWERYAALPALEPPFTSAALENSGNYYLRQDWTAHGNLLHFTCGAMSTGHCHGDKLHVDLVLNGEDVLVDGGRATYMDVPLRFALKDNTGHNTTTVDAGSFTTFSGSWDTEHLSLAVNVRYKSGEIAEYVQGGHLGYIEKGIFVNRRCIWIRPDIYILNDEFYGAGAHEYRQYFHFAPAGSVKLEGNLAVYTGQRTKAFFSFLTEGAELTPGTGVVSGHYNQSEPNPLVCARVKREGFASMITVINGGSADSAEAVKAELVFVKSHTRHCLLKEKEAQAVRIRAGERSYVVIIAHDEVFHGSDALLAENCFATGGVAVFDITGRAEADMSYGGDVLHV